MRGAVQAGCRVECRVGGRAKSRVRGGVLHGVGGGVEDDAVRGGVGWDEMGKGKNGVRNHFGRHFTNIVYIIKKMF